MGLRRVEIDERWPLERQLELDLEPVTIVIRYGVAPEHHQAFIEAWGEEARYMLRQRGCRSVQMHRGVSGDALLEVATWASTGDLRAAASTDEFRMLTARFPPCTSSPQVLTRLAVPGVCEGEPLSGADVDQSV